MESCSASRAIAELRSIARAPDLPERELFRIALSYLERVPPDRAAQIAHYARDLLFFAPGQPPSGYDAARWAPDRWRSSLDRGALGAHPGYALARAATLRDAELARLRATFPRALERLRIEGAPGAGCAARLDEGPIESLETIGAPASELLAFLEGRPGPDSIGCRAARFAPGSVERLLARRPARAWLGARYEEAELFEALGRAERWPSFLTIASASEAGVFASALAMIWARAARGGVRSLSLRGLGGVSGAPLAAPSAPSLALDSLELSALPIEEEWVRGALESAPRLRRLVLADLPIRDWLSIVSERGTALRSLAIADAPICVTDLWRWMRASAPDLGALSLSRLRVDLSRAAVLAPWSAARLEELALRGIAIGAGGARSLARSDLGSLRALDLSGCAIGRAGVEALARAPWIGRVSRIRIDDDPGAGRALAALCEAAPSLRVLSAQGAGVSAPVASSIVREAAGLHGLYLERNGLDLARLEREAPLPHLIARA